MAEEVVSSACEYFWCPSPEKWAEEGDNKWLPGSFVDPEANDEKTLECSVI